MKLAVQSVFYLSSKFPIFLFKLLYNIQINYSFKQNVNIIAIDDLEESINQFEPVLARGVVEDTKAEELLRSVGIDTCDTVVVAIGESLESSVIAFMHYKSLGVPTVVVMVNQEGLGKKSVLM